jgi:hypothetical protein
MKRNRNSFGIEYLFFIRCWTFIFLNLNLISYNYFSLCGPCELERPKGAGESIECSVLGVCFYIRSAGGGQVLARLWRVGRSMFDVRRSSFKIIQYSINATCDRLQNNLAIMELREGEKKGNF